MKGPAGRFSADVCLLYSVCRCKVIITNSVPYPVDLPFAFLPLLAVGFEMID